MAARAKSASSGFTLIEVLACQPKPAGRRQARSAFTLIELLVVIAIISLLISILVPTLSQAKELARRAVCRINVRQCAVSLHVYAEDFQQKLPLFFHNSKQQNHWIWYGGVSGNNTYKPHWFWQGILYVGRALEEPRMLYCPSEKVYRFNGPGNPWPVQDFISTRSSYGSRPMVGQLAGNLYWTTNMPRLDDLADNAVFSDWTAQPQYVGTPRASTSATPMARPRGCRGPCSTRTSSRARTSSGSTATGPSTSCRTRSGRTSTRTIEVARAKGG